MQALSPWFETARLISWIRKVRSSEAEASVRGQSGIGPSTGPKVTSQGHPKPKKTDTVPC